MNNEIKNMLHIVKKIDYSILNDMLQLGGTIDARFKEIFKEKIDSLESLFILYKKIIKLKTPKGDNSDINIVINSVKQFIKMMWTFNIMSTLFQIINSKK